MSSKLLDALRHRGYMRMDGAERDLYLSELEALREIVYKLDLHNSSVKMQFGDKVAQVLVGVHSSETRLGTLENIDPDEAGELIALFDELIPIIEMAMKHAH